MLKKLQEEQAKVYAEMNELRDAALKEGKFDNKEDESKWDALNTRYDQIAEQLDQLEKVAALDKRDEEIRERIEKQVKDAELRQQTRNAIASASVPAREEDPSPNESRYELHAEALVGWLRSSRGLESEEERQAMSQAGYSAHDQQIDIPMLRGTERSRFLESRADVPMSVGSSPAGGYTVPRGFVYQLEEALIDQSTMRQLATVLRTASGNTLDWPMVDDTTNEVSWISEFDDAGEKKSPTFKTMPLGAYKASAIPIQISTELLQDSAFDMESYIARAIGERLGRGTERAYIEGTGTGQPTGLAASGVAVGATAGSATGITGNNIIDLTYSVAEVYSKKPGVCYLMHRQTTALLRKLKDTDGQYLWQPSLLAGTPDMLFGYPIRTSVYLPTPASAAKPIYFGDFSKFIIRDVASIRVGRDPYTAMNKDAINFYCWFRTDSKYLNAGTDPIKCLQMAGAGG